MRIDVLTLFPGACEPFFSASILGRAQQAGLVTIRCHDIRAHTTDPHGKVDDRPFGGGPGMVMMCQPVFDAVAAVEAQSPESATRVLLTPQGRRFDQAMAAELAGLKRLLLISGRYEGFDERIRLGLSPREISVGDYVLSGGEAAAMVLVDAVVRLIPGVLGHEESIVEESFSPAVSRDDSQAAGAAAEGLLEYPQYTRPRQYAGMDVPDVLLSGDHAKIRSWRREQAVLRTAAQRPDLMSGPGRPIQEAGGRS
jgi:tRNA (guanine37-N1)-methyltransferase